MFRFLLKEKLLCVDRASRLIIWFSHFFVVRWYWNYCDDWFKWFSIFISMWNNWNNFMIWNSRTNGLIGFCRTSLDSMVLYGALPNGPENRVIFWIVQSDSYKMADKKLASRLHETERRFWRDRSGGNVIVFLPTGTTGNSTVIWGPDGLTSVWTWTRLGFCPGWWWTSCPVLTGLKSVVVKPAVRPVVKHVVRCLVEWSWSVTFCGENGISPVTLCKRISYQWMG